MNKKKFLLNNIASFANELAAVISSLIIPKLLISYYGSATNGLIVSIMQFLSFFSFCEAGIGPVIRANLYKPLANRDNDSISRIFKSSRHFFRTISFLFIGYMIVIMILYPFINSSDFDAWFIILLIAIISMNSFSRYFFGITYQVLLTADQAAYVHLFISVAAIVINVVVEALLIILGMPIYVTLFFSGLIFSLKPAAYAIYIRKHYSINTKITYKSEPIKQKWNGFAQHLGTIVQDNTDTIVLTLFSTLNNVSVYSVYSLVIRGMSNLLFIVNNSVSAVIGTMIARKESDKLNETFDIFEWTYHSLTTVLFSITGTLIIPFIRIYTSDITDTNYIFPVFAVLITICGAIRCYQLCYIIVVQAAGHFKETQIASFIEPIINIGLSIALVIKFGLVGVAIGTVISLIYRLVYLVCYLSKHILFRTTKKFMKQIIADIVTVLLTLAATNIIPIQPVNYMEWILIALVITLVAIISAVIVNLIFYRGMLLHFALKVKKAVASRIH